MNKNKPQHDRTLPVSMPKVPKADPADTHSRMGRSDAALVGSLARELSRSGVLSRETSSFEETNTLEQTKAEFEESFKAGAAEGMFNANEESLRAMEEESLSHEEWDNPFLEPIDGSGKIMYDEEEGVASSSDRTHRYI